MANDAVFRASLVWLAAVIVVVGVCTQSFKKMMLTYVVGVLGISGLLLPDWGYFDRDFSRWTSPVSAEERASELAQRSGLIRRSVYFYFFGHVRFTGFSIECCDFVVEEY